MISALILSVIFRLGNLATKPYWEDEVYTSVRVSGYRLGTIQGQLDRRVVSIESLSQYQDVAKSGRSWSDSFNALLNRPEHAPLYFVLARAWAQVFGSSVGAMRALPAVIGLVTLPLFYWFSRLLFNSSITANITLCLACVSPILIRQAQEARPYSLWMAGILASSAMLLSALRSNKRSAWILYSLTVALVFWTHLLSGLVFVIHSLYVLFLRRSAATGFETADIRHPNVEKITTSPLERLAFQRPLVDRSRFIHFRKFLLVGMATILPWLYRMFYRFDSVQVATEWQNTSLPLGALMSGWTNNISHLAFFWMPRDRWLIFASFWVLVFAWCVSLLLSKTQLRQWLLPILLCVVPSILLIGLDLLFGGIRSLTPRYFIPAYLGAIFILGFGLSSNLSQLQNSPTAKRYCYFQWGLFHIILIMMISASWNNLHSPVWWKDSHLRSVKVAQTVTQSESPATIVSDYRLGNFMSVGLQLRPTDRFLWFRKAGITDEEVDIDKIVGSSDNVFLFLPSKSLLNQIEDGLVERHLAIEQTEIKDLYALSKPVSP
ncbi:hypothetical protein S7335_3997 [Synechococcus sp. PCC 7335]|uniref:glycosyltransferase family 39 protein n=1 Tax=Synechococcus sp. (strain ATCC 29403 / PCC 7335) TaxID=91464 RepID=UPI00017EDFEB|nr:glycosyltransferase family 39 protein [Synechococcus sp. PCC 7335]EDX86294.1 hypothetical protein S7335_3997 [Synechococcus sp. PCC 7335]